MARTTSTTRNEVSSEISVFDLVYLIAENRGSMQTQKQLGEVLFQNEAQLAQAMKDAAMEYLKPIVFKMAGVTVREISDNGAQSENPVSAESLEIAAAIVSEALVNGASVDNSAMLQETKSLKSGKR